MQCKGKTKDGGQCQANALKGGKHCFFHSPDISETEKKLAQAKGGENRALKTTRQALPAMPIVTVKDVKAMLAETINAVRAGALDLKTANCLGFLSNHMLKAIELGDMEFKMQDMEKVIYERKTTLK